MTFVYFVWTSLWKHETGCLLVQPAVVQCDIEELYVLTILTVVQNVVHIGKILLDGIVHLCLTL